MNFHASTTSFFFCCPENPRSQRAAVLLSRVHGHLPAMPHVQRLTSQGKSRQLVALLWVLHPHQILREQHQLCVPVSLFWHSFAVTAKH